VKNYITNFMFMINGPGTIEDKSKSLSGAIQAIEGATKSGIYASDCLVTWAKNMGFFEDQKFVDCINRRLTGDATNDAKLRGIIWRTHTLCWAATQCLGIDGDYVEAGCYDGDTARIAIDYTDFAKTKKTYWLYDLFDNDGTLTPLLPKHKSGGMYEETVAKFAEMKNVKVIKGMIPDSFQQGAPAKVAFLHIDMNNVPAERGALETLYERVQPGGLILLDDYGWVQNRPQKDSADEFLARFGRKILEMPTGQGFAIR